MVKPEDVPSDTIWKTTVHVCHGLFNASVVVPFDNMQSSVIYGWDEYNNTDKFYMTIYNRVNILFELDTNVAAPKLKQ